MEGPDLAGRCDELLHPQRGLCRGMILNTDKPHDRPEDIFPTTVGELFNAAAVVRDCRAALVAAQAVASAWEKCLSDDEIDQRVGNLKQILAKARNPHGIKPPIDERNDQ